MFYRVHAGEFLAKIKTLPEAVKSMLTLYQIEEVKKYEFYINLDRSAGYGISPDKELVNFFSLRKGQGREALFDAIRQGANNLNCFDTWLVSFYTRHGFKEYRREKNWTEGQPDVVYMKYEEEDYIPCPVLENLKIKKESCKKCSVQSCVNWRDKSYEKQV